MDKDKIDVYKNLIYKPFVPTKERSYKLKSSIFIGIDTEAYQNGKCFMICTSLGDIFTPVEFPHCLFTRKYRNKYFVSYNLKYEISAFMQILTKAQLKELQQTDKVKYNEYTFKVIGHKCLKIIKGRNNITFFDAHNFFKTSLQKASNTYLGESKLESPVTKYTKKYVSKHWVDIAKYCIQDAVLCARLIEKMILTFESYGLYVTKLFSVAYISCQYFQRTCKHVSLKYIWEYDRKVIDYGLQSYYGGKFEVSRKGPGYYYSYDIVSAYPYEISRLIDITNSYIEYSKKFDDRAVYAFMKVKVKIAMNLFTTIPIKKDGVNKFMCGEFTCFITKNEYIYLTSIGVDITIIESCNIYVNEKIFPYKKQIKKLMKMKSKYKKLGDKINYNNVKILLNSFYGKFVQLVKSGDNYKASTVWNILYASVITANTRIKIVELQNLHPEVVAVHTDSVISTKKLDFNKNDILGNMSYEKEGNGIILGSGIYQIGDSVKMRGFDTNLNLIKLCDTKKSTIKITNVKVYTWREVAHRSMDLDYINKFEDFTKEINIRFDRKRFWLGDYKTFSEVLVRNVESLPLKFGSVFG